MLVNCILKYVYERVLYNYKRVDLVDIVCGPLRRGFHLARSEVGLAALVACWDMPKCFGHFLNWRLMEKLV